jgi:hypothetical protein
VVPLESFIESVKDCIGTPVVHMGRLSHKALDCVGLPWAACNALGMELPATGAYNAMPSGNDLSRGLMSYCDPVDVGGHIWQVYVGQKPRHCVVPVGLNGCGEPVVVHAWGMGRRVCETIYSRRRIFARWRIRGVE